MSETFGIYYWLNRHPDIIADFRFYRFELVNFPGDNLYPSFIKVSEKKYGKIDPGPFLNLQPIYK